MPEAEPADDRFGNGLYVFEIEMRERMAQIGKTSMAFVVRLTLKEAI